MSRCTDFHVECHTRKACLYALPKQNGDEKFIPKNYAPGRSSGCRQGILLNTLKKYSRNEESTDPAQTTDSGTSHVSLFRVPQPPRKRLRVTAMLYSVGSHGPQIPPTLRLLGCQTEFREPWTGPNRPILALGHRPVILAGCSSQEGGKDTRILQATNGSYQLHGSLERCDQRALCSDLTRANCK